MSVPFIWEGLDLSRYLSSGVCFSVTLPLGLTWQEKARSEQQRPMEVSCSLFHGVLTGDVPGRAGSCGKDHSGALGQTGAEGDVPTCKAAGCWFPSGRALLWGHMQAAAAGSLGWTVAVDVPWAWGLLELWGCVPPGLSGSRRARGWYHFVDSRAVHLFHCCIVWVLGLFFMKTD